MQSLGDKLQQYSDVFLDWRCDVKFDIAWGLRDICTEITKLHVDMIDIYVHL